MEIKVSCEENFSLVVYWLLKYLFSNPACTLSKCLQSIYFNTQRIAKTALQNQGPRTSHQ